MRTFTDPGLWAHPGHGLVQGLMALALLIAAAPLTLTWIVGAKVRAMLVPAPADAGGQPLGSGSSRAAPR